MSKGKKIGLFFLALVLLAVGFVGGQAVRLMQSANGEQTGGGSKGFWDSVNKLKQIGISPKEGFPGKDKLVVLCMGIDDNWTNKDMVYTKDARTDTMFLLSLDLNTHKVAMLSIPRDTYAHIAGTHWNFKVNAAYQTGGPQRAIETVNELLGVHADHFLVLNIDSTKKMVDALGGVDVNVEHEMHYHDTWGHLSIDLMPGPQHLTGEQAVGFARYRHPDAGKKATPEDGDERRMYRQHVLLKAMVGKAKNFANVADAPHMVDVAMSTIRTDLTRAQLFDLAAIFRGAQPDDIQTASLPGDDFRGPKGEWFYKLDPEKSKAYVDWLIRGDSTASRRLVAVTVRNGTKIPGLARRAVEQLKAAGYAEVHNGGNAPRPFVQLTGGDLPKTPARTTLLDTGVPDPKAPQDIAFQLGVTEPAVARRKVKPNKVGWTPPTEVVVTLGQDYAQTVSPVSGPTTEMSAAPATLN